MIGCFEDAHGGDGQADRPGGRLGLHQCHPAQVGNLNLLDHADPDGHLGLHFDTSPGRRNLFGDEPD